MKFLEGAPVFAAEVRSESDYGKHRASRRRQRKSWKNRSFTRQRIGAVRLATTSVASSGTTAHWWKGTENLCSPMVLKKSGDYLGGPFAAFSRQARSARWDRP